MKIFFDTSVLVAASERSHPHHAQAWPALRRVANGDDVGYMSVHSIAETYAALTRLPVSPRIPPTDAARIVTENILRHFETVPAGQDEYLEALTLVRDGGWSGAKIYDALLLTCAARCPAERIYTFNLADFRLLAPANVQARVCEP
jgi:predicted nucleic acid-binding protein